MTNLLPHDTLYTSQSNNGVKMKVGDLVTLSAAGRKQNQNGLVKQISDFGIVVRIDSHMEREFTEEKPFYRVNWFIRSGVVSPHYSRLLSKYGHWRYEIKKYKKTS